MRRYCYVCKSVREFGLVSMIILNRNKLWYCLSCRVVVFTGVEASEEVKESVDKKEFYEKLVPAGAGAH